jgi:hypothetical protein
MYCENLVMIGLMAEAGDKFKNRAPIPLTPCILYFNLEKGRGVGEVNQREG